MLGRLLSAVAPPAPAAAAPTLDPDDVTACLKRTFSSPSYKPPLLPAVALEVMQLSQRPNIPFEEVVRVLSRDPVLAGRVLSLAQTAAYAGRSPIQTLPQAVVRLGLKTMRDVVLEASLHLKVFRVPGFEAPVQRLARHSVAVAHVMRAVCRRIRVESEFAFLVGLLHDVGFAASYLALAESPSLRGLPIEPLAPVLDAVHEEASGLLTRLWKLPEAIHQVVACHHDVMVDGKAEPLNAALIVAEQLAWEAGAGVEPPPEDADPRSLATPEPPLDGLDVNWIARVNEARALLRLDDLQLGAARAEAFEIVKALEASAK
jgi:putative nucleotidyltransferase with HDIG domain